MLRQYSNGIQWKKIGLTFFSHLWALNWMDFKMQCNLAKSTMSHGNISIFLIIRLLEYPLWGMGICKCQTNVFHLAYEYDAFSFVFKSMESKKLSVQGLGDLICVFKQRFNLAEGKGAIDRTNNNNVCIKINLQNI